MAESRKRRAPGQAVTVSYKDVHYVVKVTRVHFRLPVIDNLQDQEYIRLEQCQWRGMISAKPIGTYLKIGFSPSFPWQDTCSPDTLGRAGRLEYAYEYRVSSARVGVSEKVRVKSPGNNDIMRSIE